jgi:hypothetical protein
MSEDSEKPSTEAPILAKAEKAEFTEWDYAKAYAGLLGNPHRLFTNNIRYLREQAEKTGNVFLPSTASRQYPLSTIIHSPSFKSVIYYAALALQKDKLKALPALTPATLLTVFTPEELAAVIAITYLYRRAKKNIDPRVWEGVAGEVHVQMEAGYQIGAHIPAIGQSRGLLIGSVRYIAMSLFAKKDARGYKLYKRHLNEKELLFDIADETKRWQCNHLQICSTLIQSIGFGLGAASGIVANSYPTEGQSPEIIAKAQSWYATRRWIESILEQERAPAELQGIEEFSIAPDTLALMQERIEGIYKMGSSFDWVDKTKDDLPKDLEEALTDHTLVHETEELPSDII